jgi:DNA-binding LytR/AlgR family response regulator
MHAYPLSQLPLIEVKTSKGTCLIHSSDILYIRAENKSSVVYLNDLNTIKTFHMLKWFNIKLLEPEFYRCHNSFIVNCLYVKTFLSNEVMLKGNIYIPLSRQKKQSCKKNIALLHQKIIQSTNVVNH